MVESARKNLPQSVHFIAECIFAKLNQAVARNIAWKLASSEVVAFLDADDTAHPQRLEMASLLFSENPDLKTFTHSWARDESAFGGDLLVNSCISHRAEALVVTHGLSEGSSPPSVLFGDTMASLGRAVSRRCKLYDRKCFIVHGMVPGAGIARRSALERVPMIDCSDKRGPDVLRGDGGCVAEDSKWMREMLRVFPERQHHLYVKLCLIRYMPSYRSSWVRVERENTTDPKWRMHYTLKDGELLA
jgi:hypothetical protein